MDKMQEKYMLYEKLYDDVQKLETAGTNDMRKQKLQEYGACFERALEEKDISSIKEYAALALYNDDKIKSWSVFRKLDLIYLDNPELAGEGLFVDEVDFACSLIEGEAIYGSDTDIKECFEKTRLSEELANKAEEFAPALAFLYGVVANNFESVRELEIAGELYSSAVSITEKALSAADDISQRELDKLSRLYFRLAVLLSDLKEYGRAEDLFMKAADKYLVSGGESDSFNYRWYLCYSSAINNCLRRGDCQKAEQLCLKAINALQGQGAQSRELAQLYFISGSIYEKLEKFTDAKRYYSKADVLLESLFLKNPYVKLLLAVNGLSLSRIYHALGEDKKALEVLYRMQPVVEFIKGNN